MLATLFNALAFAVSFIYCDQAFAFQVLGPHPYQIENIVVFGDSYSDVESVGDNGTAWPVYAAGYGPFSLYPFAKSGATCSNNLTNRPFPSVMETKTIYSLWIGTNDVGRSALLTGDQMPGVTLADVIECATSWVKVLYESGARNFLLQNMIPLETTVLYSRDSYPNLFWTLERNATEWNIFMTELTTSGNSLAKLMLRGLASFSVGAHIGLFDSHSLFLDMIASPAKYLNGTASPNAVTPIKSCIFQLNGSTANCTTITGTDRDSYLWVDELHPSEQANRVVAREYSDAVLRKTDSWVTWLR
ncbi:hypothetical protein ACEPAI_5390 [Sanghuangporus weigelae]